MSIALEQCIALKKNHDSNLHNLMIVARQHGLVFHLDECHIKETKITLFNIKFFAEGVHLDPKKVVAINAIQEPKDTQEL